jgi:hypothetical protein
VNNLVKANFAGRAWHEPIYGPIEFGRHICDWIGMRPAALRAREIDDALIAQHKQASTAGEIPLALVASALIADHQSAISQEILDIPVA